MFGKFEGIGHLGADPTPVETTTGKPMATFSLATPEHYTDEAGQRQYRPVWHHIVCFSTRARFVRERLHKGSFVYVEGRLRYNEFTDREGRTRREAEIIAENIQILDRRPVDRTPDEADALAASA